MKKTLITLMLSIENSLGDFLSEQGFKGTHLGCEQGACGACNVLARWKIS